MVTDIGIMPQIFQRFDLDLEAMASLDEAEFKKLNLFEAGRTLREELKEKGYVVLESNENYGGVPCSILVGGDVWKSYKNDFYGITKRFKLPFRNAPYYDKK